jgi:hypothetical protein
LLSLETQWAALTSYGMRVKLLQDVLPLDDPLPPVTMRNHVLKLAERLEDALGEEHMSFIEGCPRDWGAWPIPDGPLPVGIDGGSVKAQGGEQGWFEVIAGKSILACRRDDEPAAPSSPCFAFVQTYDEQPKRRLFALLHSQGLQMNQQIEFLSNGGDTVRDLQLSLSPEAEHVLDWFPLTMRLTTLPQTAKGLPAATSLEGRILRDDVVRAWERIKWFLWHGNGFQALQELRFVEGDLEAAAYESDDAIAGQLCKAVQEFPTYIERNGAFIPNYGERYRNGERVSTGFVESTVRPRSWRRPLSLPPPDSMARRGGRRGAGGIATDGKRAATSDRGVCPKNRSAAVVSAARVRPQCCTAVSQARLRGGSSPRRGGGLHAREPLRPAPWARARWHPSASVWACGWRWRGAVGRQAAPPPPGAHRAGRRPAASARRGSPPLPGRVWATRAREQEGRREACLASDPGGATSHGRPCRRTAPATHAMVAGLGGTPRAACSRRSRPAARRCAGGARGRLGSSWAGRAPALRVPWRRPPRSPATPWEAGPSARLLGAPCAPPPRAGRLVPAWRRLGRADPAHALPGPHREAGATGAAFPAARGVVARAPETAVTRAGCPGKRAGACGAPRGGSPEASRPSAAALVAGMPGQVRPASACALHPCPGSGARAWAACAQTMEWRTGAVAPRHRPPGHVASCAQVLAWAGLAWANRARASRRYAPSASSPCRWTWGCVPADAAPPRSSLVRCHRRHTRRLPQAPGAGHTRCLPRPRRWKQASPGALGKKAPTAGGASRRSCYARQACSGRRGPGSAGAAGRREPPCAGRA